MDIISLQLGTAGYHQLHYFDITWGEQENMFTQAECASWLNHRLLLMVYLGCRPREAGMRSELWGTGSLWLRTPKAAWHTPGFQRRRRYTGECCRGWSARPPGRHKPLFDELWCRMSGWHYGGLSHLGSGLQQQAGTVRMSLYAGFVERGDVVHSHHVDRRSGLYKLFELQGPAVGRCFVQGGPVCPEALDRG